jgi:hypothetical protein
VHVVDFSKCFKVFEPGFSETAFKTGVFWLGDAKSFCDEFLFEVVKNSEFSDFRIPDHVFRDFGFFVVFVQLWFGQIGTRDLIKVIQQEAYEYSDPITQVGGWVAREGVTEREGDGGSGSQSEMGLSK